MGARRPGNRGGSKEFSSNTTERAPGSVADKCVPISTLLPLRCFLAARTATSQARRRPPLRASSARWSPDAQWSNRGRKRIKSRVTPREVLAGIQYDPSSGTSQYAVARNGTLVYQRGAPPGTSLMWADARGPLEAFPDEHVYYDPRLSPDGRTVAVEALGEGDDIWVLDLTRGTQTRLSLVRASLLCVADYWESPSLRAQRDGAEGGTRARRPSAQRDGRVPEDGLTQ